MKQIKILVALLFATAIAMPAMSATVTWTGGANARVGYQQLNADNTHGFSAILMSKLSGNADNLSTDITASTTAMATAFMGQLIAVGGNFALVSSKEKNLLVAAGFTSTDATAIATAYGAAGGGAAGQAAAAVVFGTWAATETGGISNGVKLFQNDATLAGYLTKEYIKKGHYSGLKNENSVNMAANIVSDSKKLTGKIEMKFATPEAEAQATRPIDLEQAWLQYDLGMLAIRYDTAGFNSRWDADVIYVGDYTGQNSLDFQIKPVADMGYAFVTILSDRGLDNVKYQNTQERSSTTPMLSAGYVYESSMIDATVGGVYDKYKGLYADDYTGYMGFAEVKVKSGQMGTEVGSFSVKLAGVYGKNTSRFAGMDSGDMEQATLGVSNLYEYLSKTQTDLELVTISKGAKDSTVYGGHLSATYTAWMGGMINFDARISQAKISESDPYFAQRYTLAVIQALDANFFVTLAGGYEQYSVVPGDDAADYAWGYEATVDFGYRF